MQKLQLGAVVFDGFELLDLFGPLEMFGLAREQFDIRLLSFAGSKARSSAGPVVEADHSFNAVERLDLLLVPGGLGTRQLVENQPWIDALHGLAERSHWVASVCTGSALLARTGVLDGRRATTNKLAYRWATAQGHGVDWQPKARWVEDGEIFTSSGVSAGTDMALAMIARICGHTRALEIAHLAEYIWNQDPTDDPFAMP
ncbi:DJ-1/PfpI family protein [Dongshaea marina]|uniref:DJ-1/PfpI family protein n=1 Tax=Dongshaea marina TaxID=2047966 RepID=UPI000D3E167B|nr:DJ-1/PfpI family protein [Dongshaea marina]